MNIESKDDGRRPGIGYPDSCAYCRNKPGEPHKPDCHVPDRTVVVEFTTRMVIEVPRVWDENMINFHMNESSACMSRWVEQLFLETNQSPNLCTICFRSEMKYLHEAYETDHTSLHYLTEEQRIELARKLLRSS